MGLLDLRPEVPGWGVDRKEEDGGEEVEGVHRTAGMAAESLPVPRSQMTSIGFLI